MRRILAIAMIFFAMAFCAFAEDAPKAIAFSGQVSTGFKADLGTAADNNVYTWSDDAGTPIRINFRIDYNATDNAGVTVNFRADGLPSRDFGSRAAPYINRGFAWAKFLEGKMKVRTGFLWDTDYETSYNAWDTSTIVEWATSVDFFPTDKLELGFVLPTPLSEDSVELLKKTSFGVNYVDPEMIRLCGMFNYDNGFNLNGGADLLGIKDTTVRFEFNLLAFDMPSKSYEFFVEFGKKFSFISFDFSADQVMAKSGDDFTYAYKFYPNVTIPVGKVTSFTGSYFNISADKVFSIHAEEQVAFAVNPKSTIKAGAYYDVNDLSDFSKYSVSPYFNMIFNY